MTYPGPELPENPTDAQRKKWRAAFDRWAAEERARVSFQRSKLAKVSKRPREALERAMLDRAWVLLDAGECEAADALLEFCSDAAATALLDEFFPEVGF